MTPLMQLLSDLVHTAGTQGDAAKMIGISTSRYGRILKGKRESLNVKNCLRLAAAARKDPADVLRAADKSEIAEMVQRAYGRAPMRPKEDPAANLPDDLEPLVSNWEVLDDLHRTIAKALAEYAARASTVKAHRRKPTKRRPRAAARSTDVSDLLATERTMVQPAGQQSADHPGTGTRGEKT